MDDIVRKPRRSRFDSGLPTAQVPVVPVRVSKQETVRMAPQDEPFRSPEEVAAAETPIAGDGNGGDSGPDGPKRTRRFRLWKPQSRKQWALFILALLLIVGGSGGALYAFVLKPKPAPVVQQQAEPEPEPEPVKPTTEASRLSGVQINPETNKLPILSVQVENSPDARPQTGLIDAGVVFEAIAEGGITRFNALYLEGQPEKIGPIRSLRPYYIDWLKPFDAAVAHVGGSPEALAQIRAPGNKDLDQFANSGAYYRDSKRFAPHNMYSSTASLRDLMTKKGFTSSTFTSFPRKAESPATTLNARTVDLTISSFYYNVHYDYDAGTNSYLRSEGGKPHMDEKTGRQLSPKVVIAVVMQRGRAADGQHTQYTTTGSGKVYIFQDGIVHDGVWRKSSRDSQWEFTDNDGKAIPLNPGQAWVTMVDMPGSIAHKP